MSAPADPRAEPRMLDIWRRGKWERLIQRIHGRERYFRIGYLRRKAGTSNWGREGVSCDFQTWRKWARYAKLQTTEGEL